MSFMTLWAFCALSVTVQNNSPKNKKSYLLEIHKASKTSFAIKHFRLIWGDGGGLVSRGDRNKSGLCAVLSVDTMRSTGPWG